MTFRLPPRNNLLKAAALMAVCIPFGMWIPHQLTINPTPSLPQTLFILNKHVSSAEIKPGDIVRFPFSDAVTKGPVHLLKRVGCIAGQTLRVDGHKDYYCDDRWLGRAKEYSLTGIRVQNFQYNGQVPQGKFFAIADHKDSYDSRYFGFVDLSSVVAKAYPIF